MNIVVEVNMVLLQGFLEGKYMACSDSKERRGPPPVVVYENNPFRNFMVVLISAMLVIAGLYSLGNWLWQLI